MKAVSAGGRHQSPRSLKKSPVPAMVLAAAVLTVALIQLVDHTIEPEEPEVSRDTPVVYVAEEPTYETNEDPDMGVDPCPSYTEEELEMYRRGRNAHPHHAAPRHQELADYQAATALEALMGYLYLTGQEDRIRQLFSASQTEDASCPK